MTTIEIKNEIFAFTKTHILKQHALIVPLILIRVAGDIVSHNSDTDILRIKGNWMSRERSGGAAKYDQLQTFQQVILKKN